MRTLLLRTLFLLVVLPQSARAQTADAPRAAQIPHTMVHHGVERVDEYYWLRDRDNPEVIAYLKAENDYADRALEHTDALQKKLAAEIKARIKLTDMSVPYKMNDYVYYRRTAEELQYPIYCRKRHPDGDEQVMLDVNAVAEGHEYCSVAGVDVSHGQDLLAYAVDNVGRRIYTIRFKNLATGEMLADTIPDVTGNVAWANDNKTIFYSRQDPITLRPYQIFRHTLGDDPARDALIYEEKDDTFSCFVFKTRSKEFLMIASTQTLSNEFRFLDAADPRGEFRVFLPRERDHEYSIDHFGDRFYIRTNDAAPNFRLMSCPIGATARENWTEVIGHRDDVLFEDFTPFRNFLVVEERREGLMQIRVRPWSGQEEHYLDFGEPAYSAGTSANPEIDTDLVRFTYSSLTTPDSVYDYDMGSRTKTLLKQTEVLGGFDREHYRTERLMATAADGARVPISLVYRADQRQPGKNPLVVYGYGSYGASMDADFQSSILSLLDRGFVYAIAHIRGGEEMGRKWYEDGKLFRKKNTFSDFIAATEFLIAEGYGDPKRVYAMGGSAGGLLIGAVINVRPDLYHGVIAAVPFVDVVTTMLDDTIPLTTSEYDEWGDPNDEGYFRYMLSYSPYDNVEAKGYPHILVTAGLHDSQVQYWEPAKWVARLRARKTDKNRLVMITEMSAGHGGPSARDERYRKTAINYAFLLDLAGIRE